MKNGVRWNTRNQGNWKAFPLEYFQKCWLVSFSSSVKLFANGLHSSCIGNDTNFGEVTGLRTWRLYKVHVLILVSFYSERWSSLIEQRRHSSQSSTQIKLGVDDRRRPTCSWTKNGTHYQQKRTEQIRQYSRIRLMRTMRARGSNCPLNGCP